MQDWEKSRSLHSPLDAVMNQLGNPPVIAGDFIAKAISRRVAGIASVILALSHLSKEFYHRLKHPKQTCDTQNRQSAER
jgi:hypothetical protein